MLNNKKLLWLSIFLLLNNAGFVCAQETQKKSSTVKKVAMVMGGIIKIGVGASMVSYGIPKGMKMKKSHQGQEKISCSVYWNEIHAPVLAGTWMVASGMCNLYSFVKEQFFTQEDPVSEFRVVNG